jgi:hypothetical protein
MVAIVAAIVTGFAATVRAAAPANDVCSSPQTIPAAGPFPYATPPLDITDATTNVSDPLPTNPFLATRVSKSVWYRFTPAANAVYTISSCTDAGADTTVEDTVLAVYTSSSGCNGPFNPQGEGDEDCGPSGTQASVSVPLTADTTYYIVVWKFCDECTEDGLNQLQLIVNGSVPPPNDTCANAEPLQLNLPVAGTTVGASDSYQLSGTNGFGGLDQVSSPARGRDVVYSFTPAAAGRYSIKALRYDVNQDLVIYTFLSCPSGSLPNTISNCLAAANRSRVNSAEEIAWLQLAAGQKIFIVVDDNNSANAGSTFSLEVTLSQREQEPNDTPAQAIPTACGIEGTIFPEMDADFFILGQFPAGWRAFAMLDAEAARNPDLDLRVTTATDTLQYDNDNNDANFGESAPNVAGTPLPGGSTYLLVNYNGGLRQSEPYRLYAVVQPPLEQAAPEIEPNDDTATATVDDRNYFLGTLRGPAPSTDVDVYAVNVAEGDLLFLSLDGDPYRTNAPINARLELLDASGNPVLSANDGASSSTTNGLPGFFPTSPSEGIIYRSAVEGVFFARVSISLTAAGNSSFGDYLLSISKNCSIGGSGLNHRPVLTNLVMSSPITAGEPVPLTGMLLEVDTGDATTLEIRWGDGASNLVVYPEPGGIQFNISHEYLIPNTNHVVTLTAKDRAGSIATAMLNVSVSPPVLLISTPAAGRVELSFQGRPLGRYRVEKSDTLATWQELQTVTADATGAITVIDPAPSPTTRFYRVATVN